MITSISLIVIITAIFIANYRSSNKRTDLIMTAQELVSDIHTAQNNTLGLIKYGLEVPAGGWGINFDSDNPRQYILFADLDRPASNEVDQTWEADPGFMSYDEDLGEGDIEKGARIIDLPPGIIIDSIIIGSGNATSTLANVTFLPPDPKTYIFNGLATSTELRITLKEERENAVKTVRVNFLGLVEVID
jgi:hypothetical protein